MSNILTLAPTFSDKVAYSQEKVDRLRCIIAHEQLAAAAILPKKTKFKQQRLKCWTEAVGEMGWPDGWM